MQAIGIGDCMIHTVNNMGRPYKIEIKDALYIPGAGRNLMSCSGLALQGYQAVLPYRAAASGQGHRAARWPFNHDRTDRSTSTRGPSQSG